ncbi:MAG TPA: RNA polymerase factor sigma-54 [Quisquiliibacterium sp.]|nr:RNA polymerase factor sigma-54 [Quisquiliibacterium sp.]HPA88569.1 RNA polymerase factor sigma-54 [Quisquiliibacterium sp.]HQD81582.1 RNA polymerase factor sigma-54 [Quisquiliibacterium sp.]HQN10853.1 RNA polymerase factor sigma-54 [Quisquiliibacterium sp.]
MKPSLQLKISQHLALTPQLQQSIRLLQLSTLELNQELEQILSDNPLLERTDDPLAGALRISASGTLESPQSASAPEARGPDGAVDTTSERSEHADRGDDGGDTGGGGEGDDRFGEWSPDGGGRGAGSGEDEDERTMLQVASTGRTLRDHLSGQLAATRCEPRDRALVELLIDNLNDDGYMDASLEEIAAMLPEELELEPEDLATALKLLQSFDPPGIAARDLSESLQLQLNALAQGAEPPPAATLALARAIVREHLALLAAKDFARLKRHLRCDDDQLRAAQALIRRLNPRPGAAFSVDEPNYVVPDVVVRRTRSGWQAMLNPDVLPKLKINDVYAQILRRNRGAAGGNLSAQLQEARWLIKNVQQRFDTILRVSQAIVDRQRAFFSHGAVAMRPLVLREIAEELGLHESTVSRVTTQKYMLTPFGTLELKYFFGSHVATEAGGAASSTAIRALIRQLVEQEDPHQPLSDSRIAELLGEQGFVVARRTVAKYREASQIPPVAQRKAL